MFKFLPVEIQKAIKKYNCVNEIRLRVDCPAFLYCGGRIVKLTDFKTTYQTLRNIISSACENSIYGYDEYIKRGFITTKYGARIGIAGEFTYNDGKISTIKNYSSLCVRIPCEINGFSDCFFKNYKGGSVLVVSKSGVGKTTFIRDLTKNISNAYGDNIVVIDERNEICAKSENGGFYLGSTVDVLTFSTKKFGFTHAVRALNPSVVVTDELITSDDYDAVINASATGVSVIATIHGGNVIGNVNVNEFLNKNTFKYYVFIDKIGENRVVKTYDERLSEICSY